MTSTDWQAVVSGAVAQAAEEWAARELSRAINGTGQGEPAGLVPMGEGQGLGACADCGAPAVVGVGDLDDCTGEGTGRVSYRARKQRGGCQQHRGVRVYRDGAQLPAGSALVLASRRAAAGGTRIR